MNDALTDLSETFQSPFSGASLSYEVVCADCGEIVQTFNLHFQEPPFLTQIRLWSRHEHVDIFQSPFSGASLSYPSVLQETGQWYWRLSISIFRSLPFLLARVQCVLLCLLDLSISIFRSLPFLQKKAEIVQGLPEAFNLHFQEYGSLILSE